jgi:hypothetical protein
MSGSSSGCSGDHPFARRGSGRSVRARLRRGGRLRQRFTQDLVDRIHQHELHLAAEIGRDVVEVGFIPRRQENAPDPRPMRAKHLLLDAADR